MDDDQLFKHFCKFCNRRFRCGRSLGGHMRSHLMNNESEFNPKLSRAKLQGLNNGGNNSNKVKLMTSSTCSIYGLRENPKRNSKHRNKDSDNLIPEKFCRECGKGFQSWKALFGHMKCHSEKEKTSTKMEDQESWSVSQSDNEFSAPNRRKRSRRRRASYPKTPFSSSSCSSAMDFDQEQEDIALSLIMLSQDLGQWGGISSTTESSENNSILSEFPGKQTEFKKTKLKKKSDELGKKITNESENSDPKFGSKSWKMSKIHIPESENYKRSHKRCKFECFSCRKVFPSYQALGGHKASHRKIRSCFGSTMDINQNSMETENENPTDPGISNSKRKMHECQICFKLFSSGQALGGHKRSHLFGCSENLNNQTIVIHEKIPEIRNFLDLNLPPPTDEERNINQAASLDPWWAKSIYGKGRILSLISN